MSRAREPAVLFKSVSKSFADIKAVIDLDLDIKKGLVVEQLLGAGQGNVLGGEFSGNVLLGYAVRNGEIVGRVKDTMIAGNLYEVLKEIAAIGRESRWIGGRVRAPHILCPRVAVSTKA